MKNRVFFLFFLLVSSILFAQETQTIKSGWEVSEDVKQVLVSHRTVQLDDVKNGMHRQYVQFKFQNKTNNQLFVSGYFNTQYSNGVSAKLDEENYIAFLLEPNQIFIPEFSNIQEKRYFVFKKMTDMQNQPTLESVRLHKLKTNIIK